MIPRKKRPMNLAKPNSSPKTTSALFNLCRIAAFAVCILLATTNAFAQFTSGVQGNVRDSSGANVPNAQMTLVDTATKVQQVGVSDGSGLYRFTNLGPGEYLISSTAKGFQTAKTDRKSTRLN